jgi:Putative DNA-binding domain
LDIRWERSLGPQLQTYRCTTLSDALGKDEMLKLETKADLNRLIVEGITESLTLDYKGSLALAKNNKARDELCKDVSAFANSAGGQIVYGIEEDKNAPTKLDDGADPSITKEWIEQILDSRIQPRIDGLVITPIQLAKGFGFVLTIPQATSRAPHQAPNKKYYKRQNFQSSPMEDYEIRDTLRRATTPVLQVMLSIGTNSTAQLQFAPQQEISKPLTLSVLVTNRSPQPAHHAVVYLGLDVDFGVPVNVGFDRTGAPTGHSTDQKMWFVKRFTSPPEQPIFQEATPNPLGLNFFIATKFVNSSYFDITTVVQTPGYTSTDYWAIACNSGLLKLYGPNDPNWTSPRARR